MCSSRTTAAQHLHQRTSFACFFFFGREFRFSLRTRSRTNISTSVAAIVDAVSAPRKESNSIELVEKKTWTASAPRKESNSFEEDAEV